ncbi:branched-chain amino acid ABC transporter permease [Mesorhizobium sp. J428]|uniref:branched-chain amino acid ABC transporter permease n=1 Tax=Mesorhizobium sp. J428 TaxID=2898440 RepID=UPI0021507A35|nr:branched-chain amino acid ABC transporter permease [Mesorhizobium sp. J428]MCR5856373.1 branched-chain amino acid ABC transporter permease [Mesorhizobium sp. J428]
MFDIPLSGLMAQIFLGLVNGSIYALLSVGLTVIFGLLRIVNFVHGAQYMVGAFLSYLLLVYFGIGFWPSLLISPIVVGLVSAAVERTMISRLYNVDHMYGLLFTLGLTLVLEGMFRYWFGSAGRAYTVPEALSGAVNLGFMYFPRYRLFVVLASVVLCIGTWLLIEKTRAGSYLRAANENPSLLRSFGVDVPLLLTATYGFGAALAAVAGTLAAPIYQVGPFMGSHIMVVVFAIVVIGGMGSVKGTIAASYLLGIAETLTKIAFPQAAGMAVFVIMAAVLVFRPEGLFGRQE